MERHRNDQVRPKFTEKLRTAARHQPSEWFAERDLAAVFVFMHHLTQRMFRRLFSRIAGPSARRGETRCALQTNAAGMIVTAGIGKWPAANPTERMANQLDLAPASRAEIFRIPPMNPPGASTAARRIQPIHQPIEPIGKVSLFSQFHRARKSIKSVLQLAKQKLPPIKKKCQTVFRLEMGKRGRFSFRYASTIKEWPVISAGRGNPSNCITVGATSIAVP